MLKTFVSWGPALSPVTVAFETLENGAWFVDDRFGLGVKVEGRGFYPATNLRGVGTPSRQVTLVKSVVITVERI